MGVRKPVVDGKLVAGFYPGLSVAEYEALPALRWSRLSKYLISPAHGRAAELSAESTDALTFGQAVHTAVLEPNLFEERFVTVPEDAPIKRGEKNLAWWADFSAKNAGKWFLKPEPRAEVKQIAQAVYQHPTAMRLLSFEKAKREVTALWMDPEFGMWCKARFDLLTVLNTRSGPLSYIVDLKTTLDGSAEGFGKEIFNYDYHGQLAWYKRGANAIAPFDRSLGFIVVEKKVCVVAFYTLDDDSLAVGEGLVQKAMKVYLEAINSGKFPGYPDGIVGLPAWAMKGRE